jgi:hypothetical protein
MPITRTAERSRNTEINGLRLRRIGRSGSVPEAPIFIAVGTAATNTGAVNVSWPTRHIEGDLGIMVIEASGGDSTVTPAGWIHVEGSPVVDIADATGSKLMVLYRFALSDAEAFVTVPDPGDHSLSRIFSFRGVRQDIAPGRAFATDTKNVASTSVTWPAISTLSPNSLVLCIASRPDDVSSTAIFSAFTNANLTGVAEASEAGSTGGNGGGFVLNYGTRAAIGDIGASSGAMTVSLTNAVITLALEPSLALPA